MKLELSIKDDKELRKHIKSMIEGQVRGIGRETIDHEVTRIALKRTPTEGRIEEIVREEVKKTINETLNSVFCSFGQGRGTRNMKEFIKETIVEEVRRMIALCNARS